MPGEETKRTKASPVPSPNMGKKLVQTRLPFKILSPGGTNKSDGTPKRRLSSPVTEDRAPKVLKTTEDEEVECVEDAEEFSDPDAIIVIHDEESLERNNRKDSKNVEGGSSEEKDKSSEGNENNDEEDSKGILIKFPFARKNKGGEVREPEPKKPRGRRKKSKKEGKKEDPEEKKPEVEEKKEESEVVGISVEDPEGEVAQNDSKPHEEEVIEIPENLEEKIPEEESKKEDEQEVEKSSEDDKDSGTAASEEDSGEEKSNDIEMICDEKLSRSSDGDNQASSVETPPRKRAKEECKTPSQPEDSVKKLTPKQLERQKEMEKRRQERLAEKLSRKKKQEEEKEQKRKEKEEQKKKEKEEKEEQKKKEKEEKEKKRLAELEAKNEEKRAKEEEKRQKEEEKRQKEEEKKKKDEEKRQKEEEKRKKEEEKKEAAKRASDNFMKFFKPKSKPSPATPATEDKENSAADVKTSGPRFMPFCVKPDMRLAPNIRRSLRDDEKTLLDRVLSECPDQEKLYLKELNTQDRAPGKSGKTWPQEDDSDEDVQLLDDEGQKIEEIKPTIKYRVKFLSFHENQRPPYYGTWRKKNVKLSARNPFAKDEKIFDYEVDSDDEWEEEEPGESLHGSDDEKDKESEDDYEVDNDFFVPHGHLSDEEMQNEDEMDEDNSPEMQKAKLKLLQQEFADEMKKKTEKLKPRLIGCVWQSESGEKPPSCSEVIWRLLSASKMLFSGPIILKGDSVSSSASPSRDDDTPAPVSVKKRKKLHEDDVKSLIQLVHGNCHNGRFLVEEFLATRAKQKEGQEVGEVTKVGLKRKLREVAEWKVCPEAGVMQGRMCWYVHPEIREKYGLQDLTLPNTWKYTLPPNKRIEEIPMDQIPMPVPVEKDAAGDQEEKILPPKKKVALLMSVPRGQAFSPTTKNQLISQFLKKPKPEEEKPPAQESAPTEIIELD
ncbi:chromatin assembly factor 1 subunit A-like isoform X2 [Phlebotomus papatasi]|uniref:chromatin assembly factor 1 subunit A-like isoform X2 n=1 Tax=Phlebotomus papatasi TaxID=29031 RepID=UPI0024833921|nr:chromatin assembly factor 1 subunit A-like isoform X2 [Phlebotomus papatasi]